MGFKVTGAAAGGGGGGGATIAVGDEGVALTPRPTINFKGGGVTATDNPATSATDVSVPTLAVDPLTALFPISSSVWPQTDDPTLVVQAPLRQPTAAPLRYAPVKGMLANLTDVAQVTKTGASGGTVTNDTTSERLSAPASVILAAAGGNGTTQFRAPIAPVPFNLTAGVNMLRLPVKITGSPNITTLYLAISSDGFASGNYHRIPMAQPTSLWHMEGRWSWMGWATNEFTVVGTGADLTAINCVRWEVQGAGAAGALTVEVGPVFVCPVQTSKALAVLSFDDAYGTGFTEGAKRMLAYGFPGVLYPNPKQIGWDHTAGTGGLLVKEFKALRDFHGWQIASHQWSNAEHNSWEAGNTLELQFNTSGEWHQAMGVQRGADDYAWSGSLVWTGGIPNSTIDTTASNGVHYQYPDHWDTVRKRFRTGRTTYAKSGSCETWPPADPWRLRCWLWGGETWGDGNFAHDPKVYVDRVMAAKGLAFFCVHNSLGTSVPDAANFDTLLAYLDANRASIDVVTLDAAVARMNALA